MTVTLVKALYPKRKNARVLKVFAEAKDAIKYINQIKGEDQFKKVEFHLSDREVE